MFTDDTLVKKLLRPYIFVLLLLFAFVLGYVIGARDAVPTAIEIPPH